MTFVTSGSNAASVTALPWSWSWGWGGGDVNGAAGVREPRRPILPTNTGGAALDLPTAEISPSAELTA